MNEKELIEYTDFVLTAIENAEKEGKDSYLAMITAKQEWKDRNEKETS